MTNHPSAPFSQSASFRFTGFDLSLYAVIIFAWSTSWYPLSLQVGVVAPEVSLTWRFAGASFLMFLFLIITKRQIHFSLAHHARFAMLGILIFSTNFLMFYYAALQGFASGLLSVIFSTASITSLVLSSILFKQRPDKRVALGGVIGICGIALVFWPEISGTTFNHSALFGFFLGLCGVLCFSLGGILSAKTQAAGLPLVSMNGWGMFYGALWMALISIVRGQPFIIETTAIYLGSLLWLILLSTLLA
ncbi:MAG: DMT family transporter, partial [Hyphomicrobiales bacterium]